MNYKVKQSIYKICLCSIFVALTVILSRLAIYLPLMGSNSYRLSLTAVSIIISSMVLGPIYGGIVGGLGDLIGALLFPVGPYFFGFTFDSILLGVIPGLLFIVHKKNNKITFAIFTILVVGIMGVIISYLFINNSITISKLKIELTLAIKIIIPFIYGILLFASLLIPMLLKKKGSIIFLITTSLLANEFIVSGLIAAIWKDMLYGIDYFIGVSTNLFLLLINLPIKVIIISCLYPTIKYLIEKNSIKTSINENFQVDIKH